MGLDIGLRVQWSDFNWYCILLKNEAFTYTETEYIIVIYYHNFFIGNDSYAY
jgi:hypothetical protein